MILHAICYQNGEIGQHKSIYILFVPSLNWQQSEKTRENFG